MPTKKVNSNDRILNELKESINKKYEEIEATFYSIGVDLIKVNMYVKNFRKWVKENTQMDVSTAYTLMRVVKRDKELSSNKKYQKVRPKINLSKLIRLLRYPSDFVDSLDFEKEYVVPGGKKFTLLNMPREVFEEVLDYEFKDKDKKDTDENSDTEEIPLDQVIIKQAKSKLDKLSNDMQTIYAALSEVNITKDSKEIIEKAIIELDSIHSQAENINEVSQKLLKTLKPVNKKTSSRKK